MDSQVAPLAKILDLNTDLLVNCLEDLSDVEAKQVLAAGGNSVAFLADRLGSPLANPLARYITDVRSIEEVREWPSLDEIRTAWLAVSAHVQEVLGSLTAAAVNQPNAHRFPLGDRTQLGLLAFLVQHDSYHLGQVGFLRRQLGKPAMSYARQPRSASPSGAA